MRFIYVVYTICKVQSNNSSHTPYRLEVQHFWEHRKLLLVNTIFAKHASAERTVTSTFRMTARTGKGYNVLFKGKRQSLHK